MSLTQRFWLILSAALAVTLLVIALVESRPAGAPDTVRNPSAGPIVTGAAGVGDPYLPHAGGGGYDVQHYDVQVSADAEGKALRGRTTLTAVATQDLDVLNLDLRLSATAATVNGAPAGIEQSADELNVTAGRLTPDGPAIRSGASFTVTVDYAGDPSAVPTGHSPAFYSAGDEFVIAGEPVGATLWFAANDHPRDPATMQFSVSVPRGVEAICAGLLTTRGPDPDDAARDRWVWRVDSATVTYATFLAVGQYRIDEGRTDGRPYLYAVSEGLSADEQARALTWLQGTPRAIEKLERYLGPYPLSGTGGLVANTEFIWGGLETAMRPLYNKHMVGSELLINHELAHMWFGDTVTLNEWNDIFNNESLTTYAEWLVSSRSSPAQRFQRTYAATADSAEFWAPALSDPGVDGLFERVYDRGPLVVHALRNRLGDDAFFALFRSWAQQRGPRSLEEFRRAADDATTSDLTTFFAEWLDQTDRPAATVENGVPALR